MCHTIVSLGLKLAAIQNGLETQNPLQYKVGMRAQISLPHKMDFNGPKIYYIMFLAQEPTFFHLMGWAWSPWCYSSKPKALINTKQTLVGKNLIKKNQMGHLGL